MAGSPAAVLWDFDGTIVDTEPYWIDAEFALIGEYGGAWSHEQALQLVGNDLLVSGATIIEQTGIPLTPAAVVERLLDSVVAHLSREIPWRSGARELLADLVARSVPCGLVTMSYQRFVQPVLDSLPPDTFGCVVTGEMVGQGKPHPEPYLRAAELLGVRATECIAIEDSPTGAASAAAAGCRLLVVPSHVEVMPGADRTILLELPHSAQALTTALAQRA